MLPPVGFWGSEAADLTPPSSFEKRRGPFFLSRKEIGGPNPEVFHSRFFNDIQYIICKTIRMYTVDIWIDDMPYCNELAIIHWDASLHLPG